MRYTKRFLKIIKHAQNGRIGLKAVESVTHPSLEAVLVRRSFQFRLLPNARKFIYLQFDSASKMSRRGPIY